MKKDYELMAHSSTVLSIHAAVIKARRKHPVFPKTTWGKIGVLLEEVGEVCWACVFETAERVREELMDVVAVCVRWYEGD